MKRKYTLDPNALDRCTPDPMTPKFRGPARGTARAVGLGRVLSCAALACAGLFCGPALAQQETAETYPSRNITLIVPIGAGGPTDLVARLVAERMSETLGKPIVIENRPGGGTSIGAGAAAKAAPDGYTLLAVDISLTVMPLVVANLVYDPLKDLQPIGLTARSVLTLVVNPDLPMKNATDLVAFARAHPDEIKAAHPGIGTGPHLATLALMQTTGTRMTLVSYRGAAMAAQDIVAGHISMLMTAPSTTIALTRDGKLRMLAVSGTERLTAIPEVATLHEQGIEIDGLEAGVWFGLSTTAGVRADIVQKLNGAINKALVDTSVREKLAQVDIVAKGSTPQELEALIKRQAVVWAATLQRAGHKME